MSLKNLLLAITLLTFSTNSIADGGTAIRPKKEIQIQTKDGKFLFCLSNTVWFNPDDGHRFWIDEYAKFNDEASSYYSAKVLSKLTNNKVGVYSRGELIDEFSVKRIDEGEGMESVILEFKTGRKLKLREGDVRKCLY